MINLNNSQRFRILHKESVCPNTVGLAIGVDAVASKMRWPIEFFKKVNIKIDWDSTAGAITEIKSNNIFIVAGIGGAAVDDLYTVGGNARVRFVG